MFLEHLPDGDGCIYHQNSLNDICDGHCEGKQESVECADAEGLLKMCCILLVKDHSQYIPYFREADILLNGQEGHYNGKDTDEDYDSCNDNPEKSDQQFGEYKTPLADGQRVHQVALIGIDVPVKTYRKVDHDCKTDHNDGDNIKNTGKQQERFNDLIVAFPYGRVEGKCSHQGIE